MDLRSSAGRPASSRLLVQVVLACVRWRLHLISRLHEPPPNLPVVPLLHHCYSSIHPSRRASAPLRLDRSGSVPGQPRCGSVRHWSSLHNSSALPPSAVGVCAVGHVYLVTSITRSDQPPPDGSTPQQLPVGVAATTAFRLGLAVWRPLPHIRRVCSAWRHSASRCSSADRGARGFLTRKRSQVRTLSRPPGTTYPQVPRSAPLVSRLSADHFS